MASKLNFERFVLLASLFVFSSVSLAESIGPNDAGKVVTTYKENQARFVNKFRGNTFSGAVVFERTVENFLMKGRFAGRFKTSDGTELSCWFESKVDVNNLSDLNKGDNVQLSGIISDVTFGDLELNSCKFVKI